MNDTIYENHQVYRSTKSIGLVGADITLMQTKVQDEKLARSTGSTCAWAFFEQQSPSTITCSSSTPTQFKLSPVPQDIQPPASA